MRKGFTLIELLVVVAIISLLLVIMTPTVSTMIERAKRTGCSNNQHQFGAALAQYQANFGLYMCFPNWLWPEWQASPRSWVGPGWLYNTNAGTTPGAWKKEDRQVGALWPYIQAHEIYMCPMDAGPFNGSHLITSYHMTGAVIDFGRDWASTGSRPLAKVLQMDPMAIVFWEANDGGWNDGSSTPNEGLTDRHRDGATFACADGHAEYLTRDQYNADLAKRPSLLWCNPFQPTGD